MKNLEQIRAKNAMNCQKTGDSIKDAAKKITTMIMDNGIIATAAFVKEKDDDAFKNVMYGIGMHLSDPEIALMSPRDLQTGFIDVLCSMEADKLRLITAETLAFMNYMRRLA